MLPVEDRLDADHPLEEAPTVKGVQATREVDREALVILAAVPFA